MNHHCDLFSESDCYEIDENIRNDILTCYTDLFSF